MFKEDINQLCVYKLLKKDTNFRSSTKNLEFIRIQFSHSDLPLYFIRKETKFINGSLLLFTRKGPARYNPAMQMFQNQNITTYLIRGES